MADQTVDGNLTGTGSIIAEGSVILDTNGQSALNGRGKDGETLNLLNVDNAGTIMEGPGHDRKHRYISYIPRGTEHREMMFHGWAGGPSPGLVLSPIGHPHSVSYPGTGTMELYTGTTAGDGVRLDFGRVYARSNARASLWGMFRVYDNRNVDLQFGFMATNGAQVRLRYASGASGGAWTATSDDGSGHVSNSDFNSLWPNEGYDDATFRRQFSISWEGNYGGGPSDVFFNVGNSNNEFAREVRHTVAMGSLPSPNAQLYPFVQFRTNNNEARALSFDHSWLWLER